MAHKLRKLLSAEEIAAMRAPIERARTFPNRAYVSPEFHQLELERIYARRWVAACFDFDVARPGDAAPIDFCGMPLLAVREASGCIRVFHNVCPYDGCPVVLQPTSGLSKIIAPYHGWTFGLDGKFEAAPYWDGTPAGPSGPSGDQCFDLAEVECRVFLHTVFVCLSDTPEPFEDYIAPIARQFGEYDFAKMSPNADATGAPRVSKRTRRTNWKTFYENAALNILHENFVHDLYAASVEVPRIKADGEPAFEAVEDGAFGALGFNEADFVETYPDIGFAHFGKKHAKPKKACFGTHYPNFYLSFASSYAEISHVLPQGPDMLVERQILLLHPDVARDPATAKTRGMLARAFDGAAEEDARITEAIHAARKSPVHDQKFYAPFWDKLHYGLNTMILDDLDEGTVGK